MRNLEIDVVKIQSLPINTGKITRLILIDDTTFMLSGKQVCSLKKGLPSPRTVTVKDHVFNVEWVPIENTLYMGDGYSFMCLNIVSKKSVFIVIPDGFIVSEWSPMQDRLALINDKKILQVVQLIPSASCCSFLSHYSLESEELSPFISIGWGSPDTQFRGSDGQTLAICASDGLSEPFDESYSIAWRADGEYFAVSFICERERIFKVFAADGEFCFECESSLCLTRQMAWQPEGTFIACEQRIEDFSKICFFEKNGLYRCDITLTNDMCASKIQWNDRGDVLMVWQHATDETRDISDEITLWTCSNWHWSQKQSLIFHLEDRVNDVAWDGIWLHVITVINSIKYSWKAVVHRSIDHDQISPDSVYKSLGAITIIDGAKLRVTVTSEAVIPAPMYHYHIDFDSQVNDVVFISENNNIVVVLNNNTIHMVELMEQTFMKLSHIKIDSATKVPFSLHHFIYRQTESCLFCIESLVRETAFVNRYSFGLMNTRSYVSTALLTDLITVQEPRHHDLHLVLRKGSAMSIYHVDKDTHQFIKDYKLIEGASGQIDRGGQTSVHYLNNRYHSFSLFDDIFYFDGEKCATNISSYLICHGCVLLTTENTLYCIKLNESGLAQLHQHDLATAYSRTIPDGALLIIAVPGKRDIVLQVPRGDLETISPRMLALHDIDKLLAKSCYKDAYMIARTDHINLNVFYDLDPERFLHNVDTFIKDVHSCEFLDNFLIQLTERNITEELYGDCNLLRSEYVSSGSKVELIVHRMIETMKKIDINFYLQPIITAYVTLGNDKALNKASMELLAGRERNKENPMHISPDEILEHMILLTSIEKMFDVALGLNKVYMIMWVASKSQKNPSEYIPFLLDLVKMKPDYQMYKINRHIRRFELAFTYLIKCDGVHEEMQHFVREYNLYALVMKYISPEHKLYTIMLRLYRDHLNDVKQYSDAGYLSLKVLDYHSALDNFLNALNVDEYLFTISQMDLDSEGSTKALERMKNKLLVNKKYKEASRLLENHMDSYEDAVYVLIEGKFWCDAEFLSKKYNRYDMMEVDIKPALFCYADELEKTIKTTYEEFIALKKRLHVLRARKLDLLLKGPGINNVEEEEEELPDDLQIDSKDFDLDSIASSHQSLASTFRSDFSRMTSSTSRQKRRMERKKIQVREGNEYENIAIIRRLHILITDMQALHLTISDTCSALLLFHQQHQKTVDVQSAYATMINFMHISTDVIWPTEMVNPPVPLTNEATVFLDQIHHLENVYRYPPPDLRMKWKQLLV